MNEPGCGWARPMDETATERQWDTEEFSIFDF
jgi:hypothetical protein